MNDNINDLKTMPYKEYLETKHWEITRKRILEKANYKCQLCSSKKNLNVHHNTYKNRGQEKDEDLIVLCKKCHTKFHDKHNDLIYKNNIEDDEIFDFVDDIIKSQEKSQYIKNYCYKNKKYLLPIINNYIEKDIENNTIDLLYNELFNQIPKNKYYFTTKNITDVITGCNFAHKSKSLGKDLIYLYIFN